jgi:hypothetical protein
LAPIPLPKIEAAGYRLDERSTRAIWPLIGDLHDVERQTTELHDYGLGRAMMEPVFVARGGAEAEDAI